MNGHMYTGWAELNCSPLSIQVSLRRFLDHLGFIGCIGVYWVVPWIHVMSMASGYLLSVGWVAKIRFLSSAHCFSFATRNKIWDSCWQLFMCRTTKIVESFQNAMIMTCVYICWGTTTKRRVLAVSNMMITPILTLPRPTYQKHV